MNPGDLTTLATVKLWLGLSGLAIAAITRANPAVVTLAARPQTPLLSGLTYSLAGTTGMPIDGDYIITVIDPLNFSIPLDASALPAYTGGGYVGISDPVVQRLISACSIYLQNAINRTIACQPYTLTLNGNGGTQMLLPQFPITAVRSLTIDDQVIPLRTSACGSGFVFDDVGLMLSGYRFPRGYQNAVVQYSAGFQVPAEAQTVPSVSPYTLTTLAHWSAGDLGVTYANGTALTKVASAPALGQYSVNGSVYTFAAADAGAAVLLTYAYVPADIEQATVDIIGDWFRYRDRIGKTSEGIEGQTITFVNVPLPARAKGVMDQYANRVPM